MTVLCFRGHGARAHRSNSAISGFRLKYFYGSGSTSTAGKHHFSLFMLLFSVSGLGHALWALCGGGRQAELKKAASHQLPLQRGLHRAGHLPRHHGVTSATSVTSLLPHHFRIYLQLSAGTVNNRCALDYRIEPYFLHSFLKLFFHFDFFSSNEAINNLLIIEKLNILTGVRCFCLFFHPSALVSIKGLATNRFSTFMLLL